MTHFRTRYYKQQVRLLGWYLYLSKLVNGGVPTALLIDPCIQALGSSTLGVSTLVVCAPDFSPCIIITHDEACNYKVPVTNSFKKKLNWILKAFCYFNHQKRIKQLLYNDVSSVGTGSTVQSARRLSWHPPSHFHVSRRMVVRRPWFPHVALPLT